MMRTKTMAILLAALLPMFSFAENSTRIALPKELKQGIIPDFFVLEKNSVKELYRDDIKEAVKKKGAKRVVLSFFATNCLSCREEFAILKKNKDELDKQGILVYLIDVGESIKQRGEEVKKFVEEYSGGVFPYYFDSNIRLFGIFGLINPGEDPGLPTTIILDSNLQVLAILKGKMGNDFPQILWGEL